VSRPAGDGGAGRGALVLIGFMGAGKTSAARAVATELGAPAIDADAELERELGMPVADYFERHGEPAFREHEERVVGELLERAPGGVIALGGGALQSERVRTALRRHTAVLLEVDVETAWRRAAGSRRPLARDRVRFAELHAERAALYASCADAFVLPGGRDGVLRALPAVRELGRAPAGTRLVWARSASGEYPAFIGAGLLEAGFWPAQLGSCGRFVVTDEHVGPLYGGRAGATLGTLALPAGEEHKTLASAESVLRALAAAGVTRGDLVVALGGGVVGDLAGFCAATYQRGMPIVHLPTTLVAQVDSAYGGKTGVDLPEGKNLVGAYHQPAAVLTDPTALETLPAEELAAGYAEVLKTGLIAGGGLWERVRAGATGVEPDVIVACARTKLAIVAEDERDGGRRQALNLGHTVAHAIEAVTGYRRYRHGEAVGLGLLAALRLSDRERLRDEARDLLTAHGLPVRLDADVDAAAVVAATTHDKKRVAAGPTPFTLVERPGDVRTGCVVEPDALAAAVRELTA